MTGFREVGIRYIVFIVSIATEAPLSFKQQIKSFWLLILYPVFFQNFRTELRKQLLIWIFSISIFPNIFKDRKSDGETTLEKCRIMYIMYSI